MVNVFDAHLESTIHVIKEIVKKENVVQTKNWSMNLDNVLIVQIIQE